MGSGLSAVLRAVVLAAVALGIWFLSNYESQRHWQNYAAKPATDFSATRADATLARILGPKEIPDPVGSAHNAEVRANIQKEFAAKQIEIFEQDKAQSIHITPELFRKRPWHIKAIEKFCGLFRGLL